MALPKTAREVRLKSRPEGNPEPGNFEIAEVPMPQPGEGQMLVRTVYMSVDPYMRGRMSDRKSYAPPFVLGEAMDGRAVGQVMISRNGRFKEGDYVAGMGGGWKEWHVADGRGLFRVDPDLAPLASWIGVLGMPGMTAYVGLLDIGQPKAGETVFVSAASGAVGAVACQIAKIKGCRVVGSAGSAEKVRWLKDEAGIDAAINYREAGEDGLEAAIAAECPDGIDVYFENVGGAHLTAALNLMNQFGRIAACGMISRYNDTTPQAGPPNLFLVVGKRIRMQGFIVSDHADRLEAFQRDMAQWIREGRMKWQETTYEGLDKAPEAFMGLFKGENVGKAVVRVGPDRIG
jgi:NADPH-dependent curcumin reductase CurA